MRQRWKCSRLCHHLALEEWGHQPGDAHNIQQVDFHAEMPIIVTDLQELSLGAMPGTVHDGIDATKGRHRGVHEALEVSCIPIGPSNANAAQFLSECLAFPRRRQDRHFVIQFSELACNRSSHITSCRSN